MLAAVTRECCPTSPLSHVPMQEVVLGGHDLLEGTAAGEVEVGAPAEDDRHVVYRGRR